GKCPSKMVLVEGTSASVRMVRASRSRSVIRSISWKYSIRMRGGDYSGTLRGDEVIDTGAQVLQHEILLGGGLSVVDLLGPLLERQLDAERFVDGEGDIEKVEAVDPQVVDRVALRLDG